MYFEIKMQFSPPKHVKLFHSANRLDPVNCCFRKGTDRHAAGMLLAICPKIIAKLVDVATSLGWY